MMRCRLCGGPMAPTGRALSHASPRFPFRVQVIACEACGWTWWTTTRSPPRRLGLVG